MNEKDPKPEEQTDKATALWEIRQLDALYRLLSRGVMTAKVHPKLLEAIHRIDTDEKIGPLLDDSSEKRDATPKSKKDIEAEYQKRKNVADELAAFAESELADDLSSLHSLLVVRLCTILEVTVDTLACIALRTPEKWNQPDVVGRLSGPLIQFLEASIEDRAQYLCDELRLATKASLKSGIGRFEDLLSPIGLGGEVHEEVRRVILELTEVRNAIVHRAGHVDKHFKSRCPWLTESIGQRFRVNHRRYWRYLGAATSYLSSLYSSSQQSRDASIQR